MTRKTVSAAAFERLWAEVIAPDLERRHTDLVDRMDEATAAEEFFTGMRDVLARLDEVRSTTASGMAEEIPWDDIVGPLERMTMAARKRCSIR